ncbi:hypothetical protein BCF33_0112 [Hasllibacter halocynthiae]|uniref:Uncharacterized protein n=1 Tax=Hasllibacter halocynthiae TaxID=595589 RepID=A0A2T0X6D7_9RHOB|nr:hypothetical protein [Hasllibacter halocynthiae]PRY94521.1 hypothetical protein BCF33_0112 [Hasllibacter halocynthiae]
MPEHSRLAHRCDAATTGDADRCLRDFAGAAGLDEGEAPGFLFENWTGAIDETDPATRQRHFDGELEVGRRQHRKDMP